MQEQWKERLIGEGFAQDLGGLELQKVLLDRNRNGVTVLFSLDRLPGEAFLASLRQSMRKIFPMGSLSVRVCCPSVKEDFLRSPKKYASDLAALLSARTPSAAPYLRTSQWVLTGKSLKINVASEAAHAYLCGKGCAEQMRTLLKELFGEDIAVDIVAGETEQRLEALVRQRSETELHIVKSIIGEAPKDKGKNKPAPNQPLFGRVIKAAPVPMRSVTEMSGSVIVEGDVLTTEIKPIGGGARTLLVFSVTDYTNTIVCKLFSDKEHEKSLEAIKPGMRVRLRGEAAYDSFVRDLTIMAYDVMSAELLDVRTDDAPQKRIELHMHTNMSSLDAVASATELIERAAKWGHKAVAITDHGVCQAFPEAFAAAKKNGIRILPGVEGYLTDDLSAIAENSGVYTLDGPFVVVDMEMTGTNANTDMPVEIGAVLWENGKIVKEYTSLIDPLTPIPEKITSITGITDDMVYGAPSLSQVIAEFAEFAGGYPICAHDVHVDIAFLRKAAEENGNLCLSETLVDTLALSRALLPDAKSHKLDALCKGLNIQLKSHHRALPDARATAELMGALIGMAKEQNARTLADLNGMFGLKTSVKGRSYHIILLAKNNKGLENLYRLVSYSHLDYFNSRPQMPRSVISRHREGLVIGSACEAGELYRAVLTGRKHEDLLKIAEFYDFLEIQPNENNAFLLREGTVKSEQTLCRISSKILNLGRELDRPVVATGDVHFLEPRDSLLREILMTGGGFTDADCQPPLYFKTTDEMLADFAYLGEKDAKSVVIDGPERVFSMMEEVTLFPKHPQNKPTFQPEIEGAALRVERMSWENAKALYGDPLPEIVRKRLEKELNSIIGNGFATLYYSAHLLIKKSNDDGYLVGSRGSVGSSFVATMCAITEVNPLPPHYYCPHCYFSDFGIDIEQYPCGIDLPARVCPGCGQELAHTGYDIPFEVFLGFEGDKVPDIDLNFSGEYQSRAHAYVEELFGKQNVFRAGTIGSLGDKKAYGYAKNFMTDKERHVTNAEIDRLVKGLTGIKRTTGQHPGGMVIVPKGYEIFSFCPIQNPADKSEKGITTTHFDFNSLHDLLVKLDILGHDDPTMIKMLEDLTGVDPRTLPLNDPQTMEIFSSPKSIGLTEEQLGVSKGSLGIPEFGTKFVIGMLEDTMPTTMEELVRISGLSHGTDVWLGNAKEIIRTKTAEFRQCICTRDDIMLYLINKGVPSKPAFNIMESVRKGRGLTPEMEKTIKEHNVPEWFLDSCRKIKYLFPKGHAAAYVTMALRVAWFKVHRPAAYYAAYFTVRADDFDAALMCTSPESIKQTMDNIKALGKKATAKEESLLVQLEIAREMLLRGIEFIPMDLYESDAMKFKIIDGKLLPPLNALSGVGTAAAQAIADARKDGPFLSVEDLQQRSKVSKSVLDMLRQQGCLRALPETSQLRLI